MINYFNFEKLNNGKVLITNDLGRYMFLTKSEFEAFVTDTFDYESDLGEELQANAFAFKNRHLFLETYKYAMRESKRHLFSGTKLHIFVLTNDCNLKCVYCQARDVAFHRGGMMSEEIARKSVDIALSSPEKYLTFEFQGGEPLINYEIIKFIVEYTEANKKEKEVCFNLVSNLSLLNDEMIEFFMAHGVNISTSLDGDEETHNNNRKFYSGKGSFSTVKDRIEYLRSKDIYVGCIQTTTRYSLAHAKDIIDEYVRMGMTNIFIRPLTPLGTAYEQWNEIGYTPEEYLSFYRECMEYILGLNRKGTYIIEGFAAIALKEIICGQSANYMELRSPCGATLGQLAYYYNGDIYTCDEGRMLGEMGDKSFLLGNVYKNGYNDLYDSPICKATCCSSVLETIPQCCDCVYNPYCGTCPVINYANGKDVVPKESNNYKCVIDKGIFKYLFEILSSDRQEDKDTLIRWGEEL